MSDPPPVANIWQDCLRSFDAGGTEEGAEDLAAGVPYSMLVFGDVDAGKWTLVNRLRKPAVKKTPNKLPGLPLAYTFVPMQDDEGPTEAFQVHAWLMDNPNHVEHFLQVALASSGGFVSGPQAGPDLTEDGEPEPESTGAGGGGEEGPEPVVDNPADLVPVIDRSVAVICLDLSQPWNVAESLSSWIKVVSDEVDAVVKQIEKKDFEAARRLRERLKEKVRGAKYVEPVNVQPPSEGEVGDEAPQDVAASPAKASVERVAGESMADEAYAGIPLVVVACKSDEIDKWHVNMGYEDVHTDYVKAHLRQMCLDTGAALVYTSAKTGTNIDTLRDYLLHRLVAGRACSAGLGDDLDQSMTFVPAGFDTKKKVGALLEAGFGASHPDETVSLTGKTTMYPKLEECVQQRAMKSKEVSREQLGDNAITVTFATVKEGVSDWLAAWVDQEVPQEKLTQVLALGMGVEPEAVGTTEDSTAVNLHDFNQKLRANAAKDYSWVIMNEKMKPVPLREPMQIGSEQDFLQKASEAAPVEESTRPTRAPPSSGSRGSGGASSRASSRAAASSPAGAAAATGGGGSGEDLREQAGNFFAGLVNQPKASSKSRTKKTSGKAAGGKPAGGKPDGDMFAKLAAKKKPK
jgi:hypothetical protein